VIIVEQKSSALGPCAVKRRNVKLFFSILRPISTASSLKMRVATYGWSVLDYKRSAATTMAKPLLN
jgi:hypothetical protein